MHRGTERVHRDRGGLVEQVNRERGLPNPATGEVSTLLVTSPQRQIECVLLRNGREWKAPEVVALDHRPEASDHLLPVTVIESLC